MITDENGITTNTISAIGAGASFKSGTNIDIDANVISTSQNVVLYAAISLSFEIISVV